MQAEKGIKEWKEKIKAFQQSGWGVFFCAYTDISNATSKPTTSKPQVDEINSKQKDIKKSRQK